MKLWLLSNRDDLPKDDDPWEPWYDKAFGFVIAAETEAGARRLANKSAGDENRKGYGTWLDPKYSNCRKLTSNEKAGVLLRDYAAA